MIDGDFGWGRTYAGRVLHYYTGWPNNPVAAICGKVGYVRMHWADHLDDLYTHPTLGGRWRKCKKCLAKLEAK